MCGPRKGQGLRPPPSGIVFFPPLLNFGRGGEPVGAGSRFLRLFRKGKAPGCMGAEARKEWGEAGAQHKGKCGGERVRKQEEPQSRLPPPRGEGPALAPPPPLPLPRRPPGPAGVREKTEYKSLTTASSPAPAPPSQIPPATAAAAALGMIH